MQASELRPGQFFEYEGRRCMWAGVERGGCTFWNYVCFEDGCMVLDYETQNFEVTPLNVTGWDDEPSEPVRECDGEWPANCLQRAFVEGAKWWEYECESATMWQSDRNLAEQEAIRRYGQPPIAEVPPPVEPEQFKPGDWVVCVDGCKDQIDGSTIELSKGQVCEVLAVDNGAGASETIIKVAHRLWYFAYRFRRATPAEVAAYLADGKSCDRNTACAGSVYAFFECQEPQPDADKPITDWVEVVTR